MRILFILTLSIFAISVQAQIIQFVDLGFKEFLVEDLCVDTNGDGTYDSTADFNSDLEISVAEAASIQILGSNSSVQANSLEDLIHFPNLIKLDLLKGRYQESVDLSGNPLLEEVSLFVNDSLVVFQDLENLEVLTLRLTNDVEEVNINRNTKLTQVTFEGNQFTELDSLRVLDVSENALTHMNLLYDWGNGLDRSLLANDNALEEIFIEEPLGSIGNRLGIQKADLSNNLLSEDSFTELRLLASDFNLSNNQFKVIELDLVTSPMYFLGIQNNPLEFFDLRASNPDSDLNGLDFENFDNLAHLELSVTGQIEYVRIRELPSLTFLSVNLSNSSSDLLIDNIPHEAVKSVNCDCNIRVLRMDGNVSPSNFVSDKNIYYTDATLDSLYFNSKFLFDSLIIKECNGLKSIELDGTPTTSGVSARIEIYQLPELNEVRIGEFNSGTYLNIHDCPELKILNIHADGLELDYNNLPKLEDLILNVPNGGYNEVITDLPSLKFFYSRADHRTSLSLENLPALDSISFGGGLFKYLNLEELNELRAINFESFTSPGCNNHAIRSSIIIKDFPKLQYLNVDNICAQDFIVQNLPQLTTMHLESIELPRFDGQGAFRMSKLNSMDSIYLLDIEGTDAQIHSMEQLEELRIKSFRFNDNVELYDLPNLKYFWSEGTSFPELKLTDLENLEDILCNSTDFSNIILDKLSNLRSYERRGTSNSDENLLYLGTLPSLETFKSDTEFRDDSLSFAQCPKIDTIHFATWPRFRFLNLKNGNNNISDLKNTSVSSGIDVCVDDESERALVETAFNTNLEITTDCSSELNRHQLEGRVFLIDDQGDVSLLSVDPIELRIRDGVDQYSLFTGQDGRYNFDAYALGSDIEINPVLNSQQYELLDPAGPYNLNAYQNVYDADIILTVKENTTDLRPIINMIEPPRPGEPFFFTIDVQNIGTINNRGLLTVEFDSDLMQYEGEFGTSVGDVVEIQVDNLLPFSKQNVQLEFLINTPLDANPVDLDDELRFSVLIESAEMDVNLLNNTDAFDAVVVNSFDPNNIICSEGNIVSYDLENETLHYTINFENLGNAAALDVRVENKIDTNYLDIRTLQILDFSHHVVSKVLPDSLVFDFNNINLPSGIYNKGYVTYAVQVKKPLQEGEFIPNQAYIYFDFNAPIETNLHQLLFMLNADDVDQDGYTSDEDCDDADPNVNPGEIEEPYNGIDDDCDESTLDDDLDGDGFVLEDDCDDLDPNVNPDAEEIIGNGIDDDCNGLTDIISSTAEINFSSYRFFPNPMKDELNIVSSHTKEFKIEIFDNTGKPLFKKSMLAGRINLEFLSKGMYLVKIQDEKLNNGALVRKIIKVN